MRSPFGAKMATVILSEASYGRVAPDGRCRSVDPATTQCPSGGGRKSGDYLFLSRIGGGRKPITTRHYARLMDSWISAVGLDARLYGTHSLRRTKVALIYRRTGNLRAVQLLLGHTKIESTVRYLGIEVDDALAIAEQVEV